MLFGSVTVPPIQNVGPTESTCPAWPAVVPAWSVGSTIVQVRSWAEPGAFDSGSISGSSWPVQLAVYQTKACPWWAIQSDWPRPAASARGAAAAPANTTATATANAATHKSRRRIGILPALGDTAAKILAAIALHRKPPRAAPRTPVTQRRRGHTADKPSPTAGRGGDQEPAGCRWEAPRVARNNPHPLPPHELARDRSAAAASDTVVGEGAVARSAPPQRPLVPLSPAAAALARLLTRDTRHRSQAICRPFDGRGASRAAAGMTAYRSATASHPHSPRPLGAELTGAPPRRKGLPGLVITKPLACPAFGRACRPAARWGGRSGQSPVTSIISEA